MTLSYGCQDEVVKIIDTSTWSESDVNPKKLRCKDADNYIQSPVDGQ